MQHKISATHDMIVGMTPVLKPGLFVFCTVRDPRPDLRAQALASFVEDDGLSLLVPVEAARDAGLPCDLPMRQITLALYSALDGIGLTAAVATRLTQLGIPCNVIAATQHDHVFVPEPDADAALDGLKALQAEALARSS